jgi:2-polyprenyl-3-methyl-5-hydroxy-6-metoxy-1,4-benzoquinol methylase
MDLSEVVNPSNSRHPWELSRLNFFADIVSGTLGPETPARILDVGAGDGWVSNELSHKLPALNTITCWDINYTPEPVDRSGMKPGPVLEFVQQQPEGKFDLIMMLDVLEHVEDDRQFLESLISNNLNERGYLLISVPAWPGLYSSHDRALKHFRRYNPKAIRNILIHSELRILRHGGLFHSLIYPRAIQLILEKVFHRHPQNSGVGNWRGGPFTTKIVITALSADNSVSRIFSRLGISFPGLSWWAICQKVL